MEKKMREFNYLKNKKNDNNYDQSNIDSQITDIEDSLFGLFFISDEEEDEDNCNCGCDGLDEACKNKTEDIEEATKEIEVNKKVYDKIAKKTGTNAPEKYFKTASKQKRDPLTWKKLKPVVKSKTKELEVEENTSSTGTPGYNSPNAFILNKTNNPNAENNNPENFKYGNKAKKTNIHFRSLGYKKLNTESKTHPSPKELINMNIREINRLVKETERKIKYNVYLKQESGISSSEYWKPTRQKLINMSESLLNIAKMIKELNL